MHDKVYNCLSTESNIGSRKLCMDKLVFVKSFVLPVTPLPPPALEMDTQDAGVTLIRLVARLKLLIFFRTLFPFRACFIFRKVLRSLAHFVKL